MLSVDNESCYDGQLWFESIDSIVEINRESLDGKTLTLESFENGDKIKYKYQKKDWHGIICEEGAVAKPVDPASHAHCSKRKRDGHRPHPHPPKKRKKDEGMFYIRMYVYQ